MARLDIELSRLTADDPDNCLGITIPSTIHHPPSLPQDRSNPPSNPTQPNRAVPQCTCTSDPRVHCRKPARVVRVVRASGVAESVPTPRPAWLFWLHERQVSGLAWLLVGVTRTYYVPTAQKATTLLPPQQLARRAPSPRNPRNPRLPTSPSLSYPARRPSQSLSRSPS